MKFKRRTKRAVKQTRLEAEIAALRELLARLTERLEQVELRPSCPCSPLPCVPCTPYIIPRIYPPPDSVPFEPYITWQSNVVV